MQRGSRCMPLLWTVWAVLSAIIYAPPPVSAAYTTASMSGGKDEGPGFVVHMHLADELLPEYGPSFKALDVEVTPETIERLHVKIRPSGVTRWEVPESVIPRPKWDSSLWPSEGPGSSVSPTSQPGSTHIIGQMLYAVHQPFDSPGNPFALKVIRQHTGTPIFDSTGHRFVFKDQYIELSTNVPEDADLYGLGEVTLPNGLKLPRDGSIVTLFNNDDAALIHNRNLYSSHPFLLQVNADGSSHGVFFLNSNGMDVVLNKTSVTYKVIGGLVDLYFFLGPSPEAVIRQYHQVIGAPAMPPYWALGVHQGRWGYKDVEALEQVVSNYSAAGIPLEGLWLDIEHMGNRFKTLTFDKDRFPMSKMRAFVDKLHQAGQRWVPIHDSAIAKAAGYPVYEEGTKADVWIKEPNGKPYVGQVWPGEAVFPDYLSAPNIDSWVKQQLQRFHDQVPFDGLWLDMNEAANFCSGSNCRMDPKNATQKYWLKMQTPQDYDLTNLLQPMTTCMMTCDGPAANESKLVWPPYHIHHRSGAEGPNSRSPLDHRTISPTAVHADGTRQYDAHNLFGTTMALRNAKAAAEIMGKRPFLILRATFPGAGRVTGHWTGDNAANWDGLFESVASILNSNMWGIAMTGADICGFRDENKWQGEGSNKKPPLSDADFQQLCNRWTSAGALQPYARNHFTFDSRPHEPYRWPDVAAAARKAYGLRYRLLTYLYSSMHLAHSRGGTLARPLFFTHPADAGARSAEGQWMMGEALLVSPVLKKDSVETDAYFTPGSWYSAWDFSRVDIAADSSSKRHRLAAPLGHVPVHLRGGTIVPMQDPAMVTAGVRLSPITLVVALPAQPSSGNAVSAASAATGVLLPYADEEACAAAHARSSGMLVSCGYVFMDSGEELQVTRDNSIQVWYTSAVAADASAGNMSSTVHASAGEAYGKLFVGAVKVIGLPSQLGAGQQQVDVTVAGKQLPPGAAKVAGGVLTIEGLKHKVGEPLELSWHLKDLQGAAREQQLQSAATLPAGPRRMGGSVQ